MKSYIKERVLSEAKFFIEEKSTVRGVAKYFHLSKSSVHNDLSNRLEELDKDLFFDVKKLLDLNFSQKHIRGGLSTMKKYQKK